MHLDRARACVQPILATDDAEHDRTLDLAASLLGCPAGYLPDLIHRPDDPGRTVEDTLDRVRGRRPLPL